MADSSQQNDPLKLRWQDRVIAGFWLPFSLLFALWVYLTPHYEDPSPLLLSAQSRQQSRRPATPSFLVAVLVATALFSFTLLAFLALPVFTSRLILIVAFGVGFRQYLRMQRR